jgi:hypothetical protein
MSHSMNDTITEPEGNEKNDRSFRIEHNQRPGCQPSVSQSAEHDRPRPEGFQ